MKDMNTLDPQIKKNRKPEYPVHPLFLNRWSPRSFTGEKMSKEELMSIFEAGKWAPSSFNNQPWRFIYALKGTKYWDTLFNLMGEFNQSWTKNCAALVIIVSKNNFDYNGKPCRTHSLDTEAAWENIALHAAIKGYAAHGMEGFDYDKAKKTLKVPDDHTVEAMFAIGKQGKKEALPEEMQKSEEPNTRKKMAEIACEGKFCFHKMTPSKK